LSINDNDDDLTDITSLPDLGEEDDDDFTSLDDLADLSDSPPDFPGPPEFSTEDDSNELESNENLTQEFSDDFNEEEDFEPELTQDDEQEENDPFDDGDFESSDFENNDDFQTHDDFTDSIDDDSPDFSEDVNSDEFSDDKDHIEEEIQEDDDLFGDDSTDSSDENLEDNREELESTFETDDDNNGTSSKLIDLAELKASENINPQEIKTLIENEEKTHSTHPENFSDLKSFAKTMTYDDFSSEGNPPFSIIIKNIKYKEDATEIIDLLCSLKIITEDKKEEAMSSIMRGQFLVPRLSEYAAIILSHKMRHYDCELLMGLTEEISPPKSYQSQDRGLSSKRSIYANKKHDLHLKGKKYIPLQDIMTTTLDKPHGYSITKYIEIVSEVIKVSHEYFHTSHQLEEEIMQNLSDEDKEKVDQVMIQAENKNASASQNEFSFESFYKNTNQSSSPAKIELNDLYQRLVNKLKAQAHKRGGNGVIGISFTITPLALTDYLESGPQYQISSTGNIVWLEKN
tara:strand:- start:17810 stop:19354 length:1545 start_codon:yes stop_codon:yes gene_type:complete